MDKPAEPSRPIVVVGSLHYDIMIDAPHQPRTGETVAGERWYSKFGGKGGNQAVAASHSGCITRLVSAVGDDDFGKYLRQKLQEARVSAEFVQTCPDTGSGMSVAISDSTKDYAAVIVSGANLEIDIRALAHDAIWEGASVLLLQNEVAESLNIAAANKAKTMGLVVCCNAAPARQLSPKFTRLIDILMVNEIEAEAMCGSAVGSLEAAVNAATLLTHTFQTVIVTAGSKGLAVATDQGEVFSLPAMNVDVVSTHGAGDVFAGAFCAALSSGNDLADAALAANNAAGRHVSTPAPL